MPTKHPRINITLDEDHLGLLSAMATRRKRPLAGLAKDLLVKALELEEDYYLSRLAKERTDDDEGARVSHEDAWK